MSAPDTPPSRGANPAPRPVITARPVIGPHQHYASDSRSGLSTLCGRSVPDDHVDGPVKTQFWCVTACEQCHDRFYRP